MLSCKVFLNKKGVKNLNLGIPWIYKDQIDHYEGSFVNGDTVYLYGLDKFLAKAYINTVSKISLRIFSYNEEDNFDYNFIRRKIKYAYDFRKSFFKEDESFRVVFGESDFLPGIVIDKYNNYFVIQISTLGAELRKNDIILAIVDEFNPDGIFERSDITSRKHEGLSQTKGFLYKNFDTNIIIDENNIKYKIDIENGQKTGYFLDQKQNRLAIRKFSEGKDVLDCFTYLGSFAFNAAFGGAENVTALDCSSLAIDTCIENAKINNVEDRVNFKCCNVFDELPLYVKNNDVFDYLDKCEEGRFDIIVLDPPAFTKTKSGISGAMRGYKEINIRALKILKEGGILVTCSCSHFLDEMLFKKVILDAAKDCRKILRQLDFKTQSPDHPILFNSRDSYYLKFYIFSVM